MRLLPAWLLSLREEILSAHRKPQTLVLFGGKKKRKIFKLKRSMKMKPIYWATSLAVIFSVSCAKINEDEAGNTPGAGIAPEGNYTVYIGAEAAEITKATLDDPNSGTAKVLWSEGDEIAVVVSGTNTIRRATLTSGAGTSSARFAVSNAASPSETYSYAIYPYSYAGEGGSDAPSYSGSTFTVTLPYKQPFTTINSDGETQVFASGVNTMVAKFANNKFTFYSLCSAVELQFTSPYSSYLYGVYLQSDNSKLSGLASIDMSAVTPVLTMANTTEAQHYVYKHNGFSKGFQLSSTAKSVFLVIPAGSYNDLMIQTDVQDDNSGTKYYWSTIFNSSNSHTFTVGQIKPFKAISGLEKALNTKGTAMNDSGTVNNCYRVNPNTAKCKICMSVPGGTWNNQTSRTVNNPAGTAVFEGNSRQAFVFCVWESEDGLINNVYAQNNWIYFNPKSDATGNALLMAVNKDLEPVWSAHVWISDLNTIEVTYEDQTAIFMDRNLGATYAPTSVSEAEAMAGNNALIAKTFGCYYQWGSPLPKPGITSVAGSDYYEDNGYVLHKVCNGALGQSFMATNDTDFPYENAYKYPHLYNHCGKTGKWTSSTVTITGDDRYWSSTKTNLDPCPNGYRVPTASEWNLLHNSKAGGNVTHEVASGGAYLANFDGTGEEPMFWIPYAGVRACGSSDNTSYIGRMTADFDADDYLHANMYPRAYYWYTDLGTNSETAILMGGWNLSGGALSTKAYRDVSYYIYIATAGTVNAAGSMSGSSGAVYHGGASRALFLAHATPIRCVKE